MSVSPTTVTSTPVYPWIDASPVMSSICFEAAFNLAGQVIVLRRAEDHIAFYDRVDGSHLCRHPIVRYPFDFSSGQILAGLWSKGRGCVAQHDVLGFLQDDTQRRFSILLRFMTEGDCNYELLRPFWIELEGLANYDIQITLQA
jgi:hypothetical protein